MDDEDFICPLAWKWAEIYQMLHAAWVARVTELTGAPPVGHHSLQDDDAQAATAPPVPEPPHLLSPNSTDDARHQRWQETVEWAETHGFANKIPTLSESEKYYLN